MGLISLGLEAEQAEGAGEGDPLPGVPRFPMACLRRSVVLSKYRFATLESSRCVTGGHLMVYVAPGAIMAAWQA